MITQEQPSRGFLGKGVLKICSKFTGEHPCRSVVSIKLQDLFGYSTKTVGRSLGGRKKSGTGNFSMDNRATNGSR